MLYNHRFRASLRHKPSNNHNKNINVQSLLLKSISCQILPIAILLEYAETSKRVNLCIKSWGETAIKVFTRREQFFLSALGKENRMEIPGISPLSGQPTLTNPLSQASLLEGRAPATQAQSSSEAQNTVTASEQSSTTINNTAVVEQANETQDAGFNPDNPGGTIDITA